MELDLGIGPPAPTPGDCEHEQSVVYMSAKDKGKSLCTIDGTEIWTNCRAWGRCTMRGDVFGGRT